MLAVAAAATLVAAPPAGQPPGDPAVDFVQQLAAQGVELHDVACTAPEEAGTLGWGVNCYGSETVDGTFTTVWAGLGYGNAETYAFTVVTPFRRDDVGAASGETTTGTAPSFGPGMQLVGADIEAGTYRAVVPDDGDFTLCTWQRLSGLSGETGDIITIDLSTDPGAQVVVEIQPTDVAFDSSGCGTWDRVG